MRWTLLDGSPRARSNTGILLRRLARGLEKAGQETEILRLAHPAVAARAPERFAASERFVLGFPLYTDAMPGQVMDFIERLAPFAGRPTNPPIAFLVQSGFPEAGHSRAIVRYLELLAKRLGSPYLGTIVRGGVEGIQRKPEHKSERLLSRIENLGHGLGSRGQLETAALQELAGPERFEGLGALILRLMLPFANLGWNRMLRQNGAYARRFDRPYAEGTPAAPR
jgi:NAD(P)H-dependent FMN reductase